MEIIIIYFIPYTSKDAASWKKVPIFMVLFYWPLYLNLTKLHPTVLET